MIHGRRYDRKLVAYLEGELGEAEAGQVSHHVAECERCQEEISHFQGDLNRIQGLFDAPPGTGIMPQVEQIQHRARGMKARKTTLRVGLAGATCAFAVAALWTFSRPAPVGTHSTPTINEFRFADLDAEIATLQIEVAQLRKDVRTKTRVSATNFHDEEIAAILVQAGKNLDTKFGLKDEARKRYKLAAEIYGSSVAGAEAKILLAKMESR